MPRDFDKDAGIARADRALAAKLGCRKPMTSASVIGLRCNPNAAFREVKVLCPKGIPDHAAVTVGNDSVVRIVAGCIGDGAARRQMQCLVKRTTLAVTFAPQAPEQGAIVEKVDMAIRRGQFAQAIVKEIEAGVDIGHLPGRLPIVELIERALEAWRHCELSRFRASRPHLSCNLTHCDAIFRRSLCVGQWRSELRLPPGPVSGSHTPRAVASTSE